MLCELPGKISSYLKQRNIIGQQAMKKRKDNMLKCLNCQNDLPNDAHHCSRCGLRLIRPPDDSVPSIPSWNLTPEQWDEAFKEMGLDTEEADYH